MAASALPAPGTELGPCEPSCEHRDCANTRRMAAINCGICGKPIGYETNFYKADDDEGYTKLEHALCVWKKVDEKRSKS